MAQEFDRAWVNFVASRRPEKRGFDINVNTDKKAKEGTDLDRAKVLIVDDDENLPM